MVCQFTDVDQTFHASGEANETTKIRDFGHDTGVHRTGRELTFGGVPRVFEEVTIRQTDLSGLLVDLVDFDFDLLTFFDHIARVFDPFPAQFADVDQTVESAEVDKRAEVPDAANGAFEDVSCFDLFELFLAADFAFAFQDRTPADDEASAFGVGFGDQADHFLIDKLREVLDAVLGHLTDRHETADRSDLAFQSAGVVPRHEHLDDGAFIDVIPIADFDRCAGQRAGIQPFFPVESANQNFHVGSRSRLFFGELFERDRTFVRPAKRDEHGVFFDFQNLRLHPRSFFERFASIGQTRRAAVERVQIRIGERRVEFRLQVIGQTVADVRHADLAGLGHFDLASLRHVLVRLTGEPWTRRLFLAAVFASRFPAGFRLRTLEIFRRNGSRRLRFGDAESACCQRAAADSRQRSL
ncbi:hypothetical protein RSSM_00673 [Rhodopirellula sallentina SM41]|uniref:Uncharacterized protein n=1 Tax=Rhodopirellula sallentina SM41 TaxID=1263870 RepID=M5U8Y3_9BACT|nr:hypothetical protein RSSM_00673 [Rhodopirellula sallentina SM41]